MGKVIHVHLTHGIEGTKRKDWYFSSISAVYTVFTAEQVWVQRRIICCMQDYLGTALYAPKRL